jgi:hypothetical protein
MTCAQLCYALQIAALPFNNTQLNVNITGYCGGHTACWRHQSLHLSLFLFLDNHSFGGCAILTSYHPSLHNGSGWLQQPNRAQQNPPRRSKQYARYIHILLRLPISF